MVKFYSDEENDNMCSEYRPIPFKLRNLTTGIVAKPTNNMTNARTRLFRGPVPQSVNAATKNSLYSGKLPKSEVISFYKELYKEVMIENKNVPRRSELNEEVLARIIENSDITRASEGQRSRRERETMGDSDINVNNNVDFVRAEQERKANRIEIMRRNRLNREDNERVTIDQEGEIQREPRDLPRPDARIGQVRDEERRRLY